jgi:hypothetical protein
MFMSVSVWYKGQLDTAALGRHYEKVSVDEHEIDLGDTEETMFSIGLAKTLQDNDKSKISRYFEDQLDGDGRYIVLFKNQGIDQKQIHARRIFRGKAVLFRKRE